MKKKVLSLTSLLMTIILFLSGIAGITAYAGESSQNNDVKTGVVPVVFYLRNVEYGITDGEHFEPLKTWEEFEYSSGSGFFIGKAGVMLLILFWKRKKEKNILI